MSARYSVHEASAKTPSSEGEESVKIRVLHHPGHALNVQRIIRAAQASLGYYAEHFGPYPHREFSLVEIPASGNFARAYPGGLVFTESSHLVSARVEDDTPNGIDTPFLFVAHEMAHQWWGHQVIGADVQGSQVLSETLAQYSALMAMQHTYGVGPAQWFVRNMHLSYLDGRGSHTSPEVPLMLSGNQEYIHYRKGVVVMYALQDYIGEDRVNAALRALVGKYGRRGPPYPTTRDLYRELQAVTPDSLQGLLEDMVATITLWDLSATSARASQTATGEYRVTLDVQAAKVRSDSVGNDSTVAMNDPVEIGVFAEARPGERVGAPLYLGKHRIRSGQQSITVTVPSRPSRAAVDPYHKLITRHLSGLINAKFAAVTIVP
jgi:aminopeptidase N